MASMPDHHAGKPLDCLKESGQRENTLAVLSSDRDHLCGRHGPIAKGGFHCEDPFRAPFIVRRPPNHPPLPSQSPPEATTRQANKSDF